MSLSTGDIRSEELLLSAAELSKRLAISERHFWTLVSDGRFGPQPITFGRAKRWSLAEVREWLGAGAPERAAWQSIRTVHHHHTQEM